MNQLETFRTTEVKTESGNRNQIYKTTRGWPGHDGYQDWSSDQK